MKKDIDNNIENREFAPDSFELVNKDLSEKIHDEKFKTKATTFTRDALKRFCRNKSSVVAAVIIGLMLLGSLFIPVFSNENFKRVKPEEAFLEPKLFKAGTGWWDGTKVFKNQPLNRYYRGSNGQELPAGGPDTYMGFKEEAILKMKDKGVSTVNVNLYSQYAYDGILMLEQTNPLTQGADLEKEALFITNYTSFKLTQEEDVVMNIKFDSTANILDEHLCKKYRICLYEEVNATSDPTFLADLTGWFDYTEDYSINLSEKMVAAGISDVGKAKISIEGLPEYHADGSKDYFLVKSIKMSCNKAMTNDAVEEVLEEISFYDRTYDDVTVAIEKGVTLSDANAVAGYGKDSQGIAPVGYWQSNCNRHAYDAKIRYVDVTYDIYEHAYGIKTKQIGATIMDEYILNGYCKFEGLQAKISVLPESMFSLDDYPFVVLDAEKCPIVSIESAVYAKGVWQFNAKVVYWKYAGYSKMPTHLLGTDSSGFDLIVRCFNSLKTSLLVAIICVAICLAIGLVWGAISGYFGGTVDLVMERITDIISGLPSIILMTLILILLGRNIYMFALSVILTGWIGTASLTRTQFYRFRDREYVLASRTLGASDMRLIFKHILPNGLGTIITNSVLRVPAFIASEATIAYLGIGLKTTDSFGVILSGNQIYINSYPNLIILPAVMLALLMISFNLFGNGLRDAVNPTLKGGE